MQLEYSDLDNRLYFSVFVNWEGQMVYFFTLQMVFFFFFYHFGYHLATHILVKEKQSQFWDIIKIHFSFLGVLL